MIHFRDYEEYRDIRKRMEESEPVQEDGKDGRPRSELVLEENTIYEIDTSCEKCLGYYRRQKALEQSGESRKK